VIVRGTVAEPAFRILSDSEKLVAPFDAACPVYPSAKYAVVPPLLVGRPVGVPVGVEVGTGGTAGPVCVNESDTVKLLDADNTPSLATTFVEPNWAFAGIKITPTNEP
jgi:hypothetical protein